MTTRSNPRKVGTRTRALRLLAKAATAIAVLGIWRIAEAPVRDALSPPTSDADGHVAEASGAPTYGARYRVGDLFAYALKHEAVIDTSDGGRFYHLLATGDWTLRVVQVEPGRTVVSATLTAAKLNSQNGQPGQEARYLEVERLLAAPMFFTLDSRGTVIDFRFDPNAPHAAVDLLRSIVSLSQMVGADSSKKTTWTPTEADASGKYLAEYRRIDSRSWAKRKLRYTEVLASSATAEVRVDVVSSEGKLSLNDDGTLQELRLREVVRTTAQLLPDFTATTDFTLTPKSRTQDLADAKALRDRAARLHAVAPYESFDSHDDGVALDRKKVGNRNLSDFMRDFEALPPRDEQTDPQRDHSRRAFIELAALLRIDDQAASRALAAILAGSDQSALLWDALASAGTPNAQAALRQLIDDPRFDEGDRRTQIIGLSFVPHPTDETLTFLAGKVDDAEHGQQARFGFGTALNHLRGDDPKRALSGLETLIARIQGASTPGDIRDYLLALGNSAVPEAKPVIQSYVGHESASVRAAAATALRYMPGGDVAATLIEFITHDPDALVRADALQAAVEQQPTQALLDAVYAASVGDKDRGARDHASSTLAMWSRNDPRIDQALAEFKQSEQAQ